MKVSVVIPCYNSEKYIEETLQSVLQQTQEDIQIICVDNGSNDNTYELLKEYGDNYSHIEVYQEDNPGANYARNKGLEYAKGEFIQFLDSDDLIHYNKLNLQIQYLKENNLDCVVSDREVYDENMGRVIERFEFSSIVEKPLETVVAKIIITGNPLYRTEFIKRIGGYKPKLKSAQDWEFHLRLVLNNAKIGYLPGYLLKSRFLPNSLSNSDIVEVSNNTCEVITENRKMLVDKKIFKDYEAYKKIIFSFFISYLHDKTKLKFKSEFLFWYNLNQGKKVFGKFNQLIISIIGIKQFLKLKKR